LLKQSIGNGNLQLLVDAGILKKKYRKDDQGKVTAIQDGYYMSIQEFNNLLAGGIYQNRSYIETLETRIAALEAKLLGMEKVAGGD